MRIEDRLKGHGIELPSASQFEFRRDALANGNTLIHISGCSSFETGATRIGRDISIEDGRQMTRRCTLSLLGNLKAACESDLDRVVRSVKITAFLNADPDFRDHPSVVDGASDLLVLTFGEAGMHARSAIGTSDVPPEIAVKIDAIFEVK